MSNGRGLGIVASQTLSMATCQQISCISHLTSIFVILSILEKMCPLYLLLHMKDVLDLWLTKMNQTPLDEEEHELVTIMPCFLLTIPWSLENERSRLCTNHFICFSWAVQHQTSLQLPEMQNSQKHA